MAKRKPTLTLGVKRFYSDLRPVPNSVYERTKKEFEEHQQQKLRKEDEIILHHVLLDIDVPETIAHSQDTVTLARTTPFSFYSFAVDIHYSFGLDLLLLFSKKEAIKTMTVSKLRSDTTCSLGPIFSKLPKELRNKIYVFALPQREWKIGDADNPNEFSFARGIGDPSGFYFPLSNLSVLRVNKQMRQEALPLAYRRTVFHLDDMDNVIKFLIAVGDIGCNNIESLELAWQSRTDSEWQWAEAPFPDEHSLSLPTLHVAKCIQLLKRCKSLRFLRLYFESDLILGMSPDACKTDPSICELCSIRGIERVEIWNLGYKPLQQCGFVKWVKEAIESSEED